MIYPADVDKELRASAMATSIDVAFYEDVWEEPERYGYGTSKKAQDRAVISLRCPEAEAVNHLESLIEMIKHRTPTAN